MSTMAVASRAARSSLNPNAPLFIPAAFQQVEDFSPEWWELVKTTSWFRDHWFRQHQEQETFDGDEEEDDIVNLLPDSFDLGIAEEFSHFEAEIDEQEVFMKVAEVENELGRAAPKKTVKPGKFRCLFLSKHSSFLFSQNVEMIDIQVLRTLRHCSKA